MGRSYGDVALNDHGRIIRTRHLDRLISADWESGVLRAEAGLSLDKLLRLTVPRGWFLPVTPGTKFVSLGGAVANDVHGKNHHQVGSFGAHIRKLGLVRSNGESLVLSPRENSDLFELTIGGLGLTGFIDWVEIQLVPITSPMMLVETLPFSNLDAFFELSADSTAWPFTVAWLDCFARGRALGRGLFTRGRHDSEPATLTVHASTARWNLPVDMPAFVLNKTTISAFNTLYRHRPAARLKGKQPYDPFFYPLDGIANWNRLYGVKGFFQHQSIIPKDAAPAGVRALLEAIGRAGQGSFLAVLKAHGPETSPGRMSFCLEGTSLALDFPNRGAKTHALLQQLDSLVLAHGGRIYAAKDGHMRAKTFQTGYPQWRQLEEARDPALTSGFWQRVTSDDEDL